MWSIACMVYFFAAHITDLQANYFELAISLSIKTVPNCVNTVPHSLYEKYLLQSALRGGEAKIDYTAAAHKSLKQNMSPFGLSRPRKNWASATQLCFVSFMKVILLNNITMCILFCSPGLLIIIAQKL